MLLDIAIVLVAIVTLFLMLWLPAFKTDTWRATATPLASIIGSGFLVVGPILDETVGRGAVFAMAGLCAGAWLLGDVMRFNIRHLEPHEREDSLPELASWAERASRVALTFAFVVSVTYYLNLLGAFALRGVSVTDPMAIRIASSTVLVAIAAYGIWRGLEGLERVETLAVGVKLSMIAALLVGLAWASGVDLSTGSFSLPDLGPHPLDLQAARTLLGLLILVQGFETSRYLGAEYDSEVRVRTMRMAQLLSSGIYITFILLLTPWFGASLAENGGETAIIDMSAKVSVVLPPLLVIAALASQLSAAVADTNGYGGLVEELTGGRVRATQAYLLLVAAGLAITWLTDLFVLINWASRAFAVYYALQALAGWSVARHDLSGGRGAAWQARLLAGLALALAVALFGIPAG